MSSCEIDEVQQGNEQIISNCSEKLDGLTASLNDIELHEDPSPQSENDGAVPEKSFVHDEENIEKTPSASGDFTYQALHSPSQPLNSDDLESPHGVYYDDDASPVPGDAEDDDENQNSNFNSTSDTDRSSYSRKYRHADGVTIGSELDNDALFPESPLPPATYKQRMEESIDDEEFRHQQPEEEEDEIQQGDDASQSSASASDNSMNESDNGTESTSESSEYATSSHSSSSDAEGDGSVGSEAFNNEDEWIDDNDVGYVYVPICADDFEAMEEESSRHLLAMQEIQKHLNRDNRKSHGTMLGMNDEGEAEEYDEEGLEEENFHDAYEGYDDDLRSAEQYLEAQQGQTSKIQLDSPEKSATEEEGEELNGQVHKEPRRNPDEDIIRSDSVDEIMVTPPSYIASSSEKRLLASDGNELDLNERLDGGSSGASGMDENAEEQQEEGSVGSTSDPAIKRRNPHSPSSFDTAQITALLGQGNFGTPSSSSHAKASTEVALNSPGTGDDMVMMPEEYSLSNNNSRKGYNAPGNKIRIGNRQSVGEVRRNEIMGQRKFKGVDGQEHCYFDLKVIFRPNHTGFEEEKDFSPDKGTIIAGRYEVQDVLGEAAFSSALRCLDLEAEEDEDAWVCLKVIKNNKDFFDQSLDEIKLLQYINSRGDPDLHHVLRVIDFFYYREHLFIVSELLRENLYEFGKAMRESGQPNYFTIPRLKKIAIEVLEALDYIHGLNLIHCDLKPENLVIRSYSRCEVKLIDFGSSCYTTDHQSFYIQSRSYRAPEVILGCKFDQRIDIWSVGSVLAELFTGYVLFQNDSLPSMLARIVGILGNFPEEVLQSGVETHKYFTLSNVVYEPCSHPNSFNHDPDSAHFNLIYPKRTTLANRLHLPLNGVEFTADDFLFLDFIKRLLDLNPESRLTAREALSHPWLDNALIDPAAYSYTHPTI